MADRVMDEDPLRRGSALRERRKVLLLCAPVTLLFTFADTAALQRFSPAVFGVRLAWTALIVMAALLVGRVGERAERGLVMLLAVASSLAFSIITAMTGGFRSPLFHWILAMPLVIAVVLQEYPRATLAAGITTCATGLAIVIRAGQPPQAAIEWLVLAAAMSALAVYASVTYRRLRFREQALRETAAVAAERARASEEALAARDDFLSVASHELKTPLTALQLYVDRLLRKPPDPALARGQARERLEAVDQQVQRLTALVESLLDVSRLVAGRASFERRQVELGGCARQAVERTAAVARAQGCAVTVDAPTLVHVIADPARLEQVLVNLLGNAVKFGAGRPVEVTVRARHDERGPRALLSVRDHGIGIAPEDQARIFDRFERAASTRHYGGLGLGLWICRRLIQEMGGNVQVHSTPGEGATFTVEMPEAPQERETTRASAAPQ
jgi:signal transduction histidine kinase